MHILQDPEKALNEFGHEHLGGLEEAFVREALEENRKILMEEKVVEAIATAATLQLFNLEKLVEEEVTETGNNLDYIENLLDNRVGGEVIR